MRNKISFKGVIIGAVVDVGGSNIWGILAVVYLVMTYHLKYTPGY